MQRLLGGAFCAALLAACGTPQASRVPVTPAPDTANETLSGTTQWSARLPANWNGTLLVHSRGWSASLGQPGLAPAQVGEALLGAGYALAASNYGAGGWALAEAVPAQEETIAAFTRRYGKPRRVIGFGYSMGGLVTTALAERARPKIDGGISFCSSMGGALGMMNTGLDGAFVFRELVAPGKGIEVVSIANDQANSALVRTAVQEALKTPAGRARIALAGVFGGIPGWTQANKPQPAATDFEAQLEQITGSFPGGVFLPRAEQEQRAGGNFSWNTGIDYTVLLDASGRRAMVEALYAKAGISLAADLATLAAAPRISARPQAVEYMRNHYTPTAVPKVPLLAVQAFGDGTTSPSLQRVYADRAKPSMMDSQYLQRAGHCSFTVEETLASVKRLEARMDSGKWPASAAPFVPHQPAPLLRACFQGKDKDGCK
jgi:pimeloyl-ACP methyl ester carboxylesterase